MTKYAGEPFVLLGVNSDSTPERVAELEKKGTVTWTSFFDGGIIGGPIATKWGVRGWPTLFLIDHEGVIRSLHAHDDATIDELVAKAKAAARDGD